MRKVINTKTTMGLWRALEYYKIGANITNLKICHFVREFKKNTLGLFNSQQE